MKIKFIDRKELIWLLLGFLFLLLIMVFFCLSVIWVALECPEGLLLGMAMGVSFYALGGLLLEWLIDVIRREKDEKNEKDEKVNIKI